MLRKFNIMRTSIKTIEIDEKKHRQMQLVILDCMLEFDRICRKNNIPYSLGYGTMLGAVRHKAFIPWDPDADVIMHRKDYESFKAVCETDLKNNYFIQDCYTDPHYRWGHAKVLREDAIFVRAGYEHMKFKQTLFLDIFILDSVPDFFPFKLANFILSFCIRKTLWSEAGKNVNPNIFMRLWFRLLSLIPKKVIIKIEAWRSRKCNKNENTKLINVMLFQSSKNMKFGFPRRFFDELVEYEFENHKFLGLKEYDAYLTLLYGDYMKLPPENQRFSHKPCASFSLPAEFL
jgi:lipopolysaccharide cholinephosphotransferase